MKVINFINEKKNSKKKIHVERIMILKSKKEVKIRYKETCELGTDT